ncbi:mask [Symbiodinium natans]|uniref:Mask protein n=1 Tax=Symbiodinium natans TaxID=878477 RepID=A0A812U520_9DINO|nr:mask [Symbiodinium natans]
MVSPGSEYYVGMKHGEIWMRNGKPVYFSYATCGASDSFTATSNETCAFQKSVSNCTLLFEKCAWNGTACLGKEILQTCSHSGAGAIKATFAVALAFAALRAPVVRAVSTVPPAAVPALLVAGTIGALARRPRAVSSQLLRSRFVAMHAAPDVVIYSRPGCAYCAKAKSLLKQRGVTFGIVDIAAEEEALVMELGIASQHIAEPE